VEGEKNITWARAACSTMGKFTGSGAYVNFPGLGEEGETLVQAAYGGNYARLVELKNQYDPTNLFRLNQNIKPTARPYQGV